MPLTSSLLRTLIRFGFAPLMLVGMNGVAVALAQNRVPSWYFAGWLGVALLVSFAAELLLPYNSDWNRSRGDGPRDVMHLVANELSNAIALALFPVLASSVVLVDAWPHRLPFAVQTIIAILVLDLGVTLAHMASHRIQTLWRFHAVHHSVPRFYGMNGLMKHPVHQLIELTAGVTPLLLVGMPDRVAVALACCVATQLLMQHSNVDYRVGALGRILALNEGHRFHHLAEAGAGDVNFGLFTLIWDRILGTFVADPDRQFVSGDLGIAGAPNYPVTYLEQLVAPFSQDALPAGAVSDVANDDGTSSAT